MVLFAAAYLALATAGGLVSVRYGDVPVFWFAAGLSMGVLLRTPRREWPAYLGAVAVCDVLLYALSGSGVPLAGAFAVCDVAEPLAGALLLQWLAPGGPRLDAPRHALRFIAACAVAPTLLSALGGGTAFWLANGGALLDTVTSYWAADAIGVLAVGPLILLAHRDGAIALTRRSAELAAGAVVTLLVAAWVFGGSGEGHWAYAALAPAILLAIRFGVTGSAIGSILLATFALVLTAEGRGVFGLLAAGDALQEAQVFAVISAALMLVAGSASEALRVAHRVAADGLTEATEVRRRFERIVSSIDEGVFTYRVVPDIWILEYASPAWGRLFGLEISPTAGDRLEEIVHPDDAESARAGWVRVEYGEWIEQEYRIVRPDGEVRWVNEKLGRRRDEQGVEWVDGIVSDITARRREEHRRDRIAARLRVMSRTDALTGLANRRHLSAELERHLAECRDGQPGLGLLLLDLDRFKVVNDTFGHHAGDEILRQTAERIADATADAQALAGRWGGEEFCVLLPGLDDAGGLRAVAETLRLAIGTVPMRLADGSELTVTATIGAAIQVSGTSARGPELVDRADRALYAGKRRGRDRAVLDVDLRAGDATGEDSDLLHTAQALALAVSIREGVPALHCQQVADLAARTAEHLGLPQAVVLRARLGGWLHDVGKIAIPDRILAKRGALDADEWEVMRTHPVVGAEVVRRVPGLELAAPAVEQHHERWDGTGYPHGRQGEDIAVEARIVAVADAYSAITSDRVYRPERTRSEGIAELLRSAGSHLDPSVVQAFVAVLERDEAAFLSRVGSG